MAPSAKVGRVAKSVANRTPGKTKTATLGKGVAPEGSEVGESGEAKVAESKNEVGEGQVVVSTKEELSQPTEVGEAQVLESMNEEPSHLTAGSTREHEKEKGRAEEVDETVVENIGESDLNKQSTMEPVIISSENAGDTLEQEKPGNRKVIVDLNEEASSAGRDEEKAKEEQEESRDGGDKRQLDVGPSDMEENIKEELRREDKEPVKEVHCDEEMEYGEKLDLGEQGDDEELREIDTDDPAEETKALEDEHRELSAMVKERRSRKEREVFVGGLDRDAVEEDVRKVFEKIGEIVEIRLHKNLSTNKNKGYAFVEYVKKEHAIRALSEMKNPVVCICSTCFPPKSKGFVLIFSN